jgi:hypothetical protein
VILIGLAERAEKPSEKSAKPVNQTEKSVKQARAWDAAEIGDEVSIKFTNSTIPCADRGQASQVFMVGELAKREAFRMNESAHTAVANVQAARKNAMRNLYSCFVSRDRARDRVKDKQISGTERDAFHTVAYCLLPSGRDECVWIVEDHDAYSPFENVQRAQPVSDTTKQNGATKQTTKDAPNPPPSEH